MYHPVLQLQVICGEDVCKIRRVNIGSDPAMNHTGNSYSGRNRSRSKQPIYTSDKRAKFTQRENKKWIRLLTVLGYIVFVSAPALSLSFYYIKIWDPGYVQKFPLNSTEVAVHVSPIMPKRTARAFTTITPNQETKCDCRPNEDVQGKNPWKPSPDLSAILRTSGLSPSSVSSESSLESSSPSSASFESPELPHALRS